MKTLINSPSSIMPHSLAGTLRAYLRQRVESEWGEYDEEQHDLLPLSYSTLAERVDDAMVLSIYAVGHFASMVLPAPTNPYSRRLTLSHTPLIT